MSTCFSNRTVDLFLGSSVFNVAAVQDQRNAIDSTVGESPHPERVLAKDEENFEPLNLNIRQVLVDGETQPPIPSFIPPEFHIDGIEASPKVEHQFIPSFTGRSPIHQNNQQENLESKSLSALRNGPDEEIYVSLRLGESEPKRRKHSDTSFSIEEPK